MKGAPARGKSFADVAGFAYIPVPLPEGLEPGVSEEAFFEPTNNTYPFGCHISMLEIDRETGEPTLLKLVAVDDAGHLINPLIVEGQIHGGLAQGIGQAMIEEAVYNSDGQLDHRVVHGLRAARARSTSRASNCTARSHQHRSIRSARKASAKPAPRLDAQHRVCGG